MNTLDPMQDGKSFVTLISSMGDDLTVVNAARVSMDKRSTQLCDRDISLIRYLAEHDHWTPFSHVMLTFHIKMPLFVARQWFKHTVGFTRNEVSRRYVDTPPDIWIPHVLRRRAYTIKQGSGAEMDDAQELLHTFSSNADQSLEDYEYLLEMGVCPEQARSVLPQGMYTEFYETASLSGYARLCKLRIEGHAQEEARLYASAIDSMLVSVVPESWSVLRGRS
jgi:thymidylate synthase (FAD)